jgi:predicted Zn-dependent protease
MEKASYEALLSTIVGLGAAIATGNAGAATAASAAGQSMARRGFFKFSRVQESTADQAALNYLRQAGLPAKGLATFLKELGAQELLPAAQQSEYVRTHPLTRNRIDSIDNAIAEQGDARQIPPEWVADHKRMTAKLEAFLHPERVEPLEKPGTAATPRLYAAAIASYRREDYDMARRHLARLIEREPDNAYFHELKGQMLVDAGKIAEALPPYRKAVDILPDAPLIRTALAHALIAAGGQNGKDELKQAISHLNTATKHSDRNPRIFRLLATAHGRLGDDGLARLYLAEEAFLQNRFGDARRHAGAARAKLEQDSPEWHRARDLMHFSKQAAEHNGKG